MNQFNNFFLSSYYVVVGPILHLGAVTEPNYSLFLDFIEPLPKSGDKLAEAKVCDARIKAGGGGVLN